MMTVLPLLVALVACTDNSPEAQATRTWVHDLQPILLENTRLAEHVLWTAADLHDTRAEPETARQVWAEAVVPTARQLTFQLEVIHAPDPWATRQTSLEQIWGERATAYEEVQTALESGDRKQWQVGRERSMNAKLREEKWFDTINQELAPYHVTLDQYP